MAEGAGLVGFCIALSIALPMQAWFEQFLAANQHLRASGETEGP